jgi:membrane protein DedA with SNARE-associated domain
VTEFVAFLESLPAGLLYGAIAALAALENVIPPAPADTAVALGAFLAGRGILDPWAVFGVTWSANVGAGAGVYLLARRYGRPAFRGRLGRRLLSERTIERIEREYERHGTYGIFVSRLLPVWRGVVMPFAGLAGIPAPRVLISLALASALWYGSLTWIVSTLGTNLDTVLALLRRVNNVLGLVALAAFVALALWIWRRLKR